MASVLLVDDHSPFRALTRRLLAASGWDVVAEAGSGEEAVVAAEATRPDVVLMDVRLPGMDGIEATRRILAGLPSTDVVLVSSRRLEDLPADAATCGAVGYLPKERFSLEALAEVRRGGHHPHPGPG